MCRQTMALGALAAALSLAQLPGAAALGRSIAIPGWRLEAARGGGIIPGMGAAVVPTPASTGPTPLPSTVAQDSLRCPLLKLPANLSLSVARTSWATRHGVWRTDMGAELARWRQDFLAADSQGIRIEALGSRGITARLEIRTDEELANVYGWGTPSGWATGIGAQGPPTGGVNMALMDCDGHLLFVFRERAEDRHPFDIYGRDNRLLASSVVDYDRPRVRFVDGNRYLIATAEAPGVGANYTTALMQRVPSEDGIYSWGMRFEAGPYANSSQFLEEDYRWVLAVAVQARAVREAMRANPGLYNGEWMHTALIYVIMISMIVVVTVLLFLAKGLIYPNPARAEAVPVSGKFIQAPLKPRAGLTWGGRVL